MTEELFTTTMKKATRKAHAASDALVNAKLFFALNSDEIWAEGLLIFHEIFGFLEKIMKEKPGENIGKLYIPEAMNRTAAFENDLEFYLGKNWKKTYKMRESVEKYLEHLKGLTENNTDLLMAYVYHLYMGLLSGGQILQKKRELQRKIIGTSQNSGFAVTTFEGATIRDLKIQLKDKMNSIAEALDDSKKKTLIEESINVFKLNNAIIKTVKGTEKVALTNLLYFISATVVFLSIIYYLYGQYQSK